MGQSLDEAFVTSSYCEYSEYSGEPAGSGWVKHHRTSSQPSQMMTTARAVDYSQGREPCGGSMDCDGQPAGGRLYYQFLDTFWLRLLYNNCVQLLMWFSRPDGTWVPLGG